MGKKRKKVKGWWMLAAGFVAGAALVLGALKFMGVLESPEPEAPRVSLPKPVEVAPPEIVTVPPAEAPPEMPVPSIVAPKPKLAIVIDDMGPDMKKLRDIIAVGEPISIAVMPDTRFSKEVSNEAGSKGLDVLVHMPMEPKDPAGHDPGVAALLVEMTPEEIAIRVEAGLKAVPGAIGLNNHMGSRFTEDEVKMRAVLKLMKQKGLIFLDSRTTSATVGGRLARELKVKSAERNIFLDNKREVAYIKGQLMKAARIARKRGKAVAIGHPYPETIEALKEALPGLQGVEIVRVSEVAE